MIQRMNNVLVKHSKILFGVITIIIIISFVWFLTPGADGSLLFSQGAGKAGEIFGKEITVKDMEKARDSIMLVQSPAYYQQGGSMREISGRIDEMTMFQFAAIAAAAGKQGVSASDDEVRKAIAAFPVFQADGKFSRTEYEKFRDACLTPMGYTLDDFENAVRAMIVMDKFQASAVNGVAVTDDELNRVIDGAAKKTSIREITFSAEDCKKSIPAVSGNDIRAAYDAAPEKYMSEPQSDALMVYINTADAADVTVDEQAVEEQYKAFGAMMTGKDGKALAEKDAKDQIRAELKKQKAAAEAGAKLNKFYLSALELLKAEGFTPAILKAQAEAAGLKVAVLAKITADSPEDVTADKNMITAICALKDVNTMTYPVRNKDSVAFALLTASTQPKQLAFEDVKEKIGAQLLSAKAAEKAMESARALRGDIAAGTVTAANLDEAVKKLGGKAEPVKEFVKLKEVAASYAQAKAIQAANPGMGGMLNYLKATLMQPEYEKGFVSDAAPAANGVYTMFYIADVVPAPEAVTEDAKTAARELLLMAKQEQAVLEWLKWLEANTKCFLRQNQPQQ